MFVSYLDFIFTHFTYFTFEIGILVFLCVVHSHGLRPCRSGKPRQGIIPCTLSASPADGRKGRESPAFLSASIYPCHSVKCCPTAMRSAYCHLTSFPLHSQTLFNSQPTLARFHQSGLFPALLPLLRIAPMPWSHRQTGWIQGTLPFALLCLCSWSQECASLYLRMFR